MGSGILFIFTGITLIHFIINYEAISQPFKVPPYKKPVYYYTPYQSKELFVQPENPHGIEIASFNSQYSKELNFVKSENDTTASEESISVRESITGDRILICLKLKDYEKEIQINIYNLLANKVKDVYKGLPKKVECPAEYEIPKAELPNGVYLCVVQGYKFRLVDKFIISR